MLREHEKEILVIRRLADLALSAAAFVGAYYLQANLPIFNKEALSYSEISILLIPILAIWWFVFYRAKAYQSLRQVAIVPQLISTGKSCVLGMVILLSVIVAFKLPLPSRTFLGVFMALNITVLVVERWLLGKGVQWLRKKGYNSRNALIIGMQNEAKYLIDAIKSHPEWGVTILGVVTVEPPHKSGQPAPAVSVETLRGVPILGSLKDFKSIIEDQVIDFAYYAVAPAYLNRIKSSVSHCLERGIHTRVAMGFFNQMPFVKFDVQKMDGLPLLDLHTTQVDKGGHLAKYAFDRAAAFIGLAVLSPVFAVIAALIKLDSKGPVFFTQERVGQNGRTFNMMKFRSMGANAEAEKHKLASQNEMSGPVFKISNDPRITRIGHFLRKTSLDELPQLINVLKGDMSLVGPRPPLPSEVAQYDNWQRRRLSVKPGITCTWQVSGRNNIDFDQWMRMDLDYIDGWSIANDAKLLLKTMPAVIFQKGAK